MFSNIGWLVLGLVGVSFGRPRPPLYILAPDQIHHPDYPEESHVCGVGSSSAGEAAAQEKAIEKVAFRVRTQIKASFEHEATAVVQGFVEVESQETISENVQLKTSFSRADLVRYVGPVYRYKGMWYQLACLERAAAGAAIRLDSADLRAELLQQIEEGERHKRSGNHSGFTMAFEGVFHSLSRLAPSLLELNAVERRPDELWSRATALNGHAAQVRGQRPVGLPRIAVTAKNSGLLVDRIQSSLQVSLETSVQAAIKQANVPIVQETDCDESTAMVHVSATIACERGRRGYTCTFPTTIETQTCAEPKLGRTVSIPAKDIKGRDGSSLERAQQQLISRLQRSEAVQEAVREALRAVTPVAN